MESSVLSSKDDEEVELQVLLAYEEVAPTKTKQQIIEEKLQELYMYDFPIPERPEYDFSGRLAFLDACEHIHNESFMKFPTHSVAREFSDGKEDLDVSFFMLGRKGSIALAASLRVNLSIIRLKLIGNSITPTGAMEIARALSETRTVTDIDFSQNLLGSRDAGEDIRGGVVIAELLKPGNVLRSLSLRENGLYDQHVSDFAEVAMDNTELISLDLSFNRIGYLGAVDIAHILSRNADLREINLEWNQFQTMGCRCILGEGFLLNNTIKRFNMCWCGLDDSCAQLVARIIGENAIEEIVIAHNRIGPIGSEAIAKGLLMTSALVKLVLDDNPLQNEGCSALLRVVGEASTLKHLSMQQCRCSTETIEEADRILAEVRQDIVLTVSEGCCTLNDKM